MFSRNRIGLPREKITSKGMLAKKARNAGTIGGYVLCVECWLFNDIGYITAPPPEKNQFGIFVSVQILRVCGSDYESAEGHFRFCG